MANGDARASGEMRVILSMMRDGQRKAMQRKAAAREPASQQGG
ncbi:hypothetical protein [Paracraurococcus lichenis]|uniref:Uncharacterized protein n=1 Tax=Paracraurococcus lichenis TaxID=3064888 RepID=A0ABT9E8D5_9PROT|nr:hypothetical protein [Paracraurococcus sp. LOR1-02]MDO9712468.1 hypothetical protein [Paracraurococcus sp. LOR1-02]